MWRNPGQALAARLTPHCYLPTAQGAARLCLQGPPREQPGLPTSPVSPRSLHPPAWHFLPVPSSEISGKALCTALPSHPPGSHCVEEGRRILREHGLCLARTLERCLGEPRSLGGTGSTLKAPVAGCGWERQESRRSRAARLAVKMTARGPSGMRFTVHKDPSGQRLEGGGGVKMKSERPGMVTIPTTPALWEAEADRSQF